MLSCRKFARLAIIAGVVLCSSTSHGQDNFVVTANFGDQPYQDDDGQSIAPLALRVESKSKELRTKE